VRFSSRQGHYPTDTANMAGNGTLFDILFPGRTYISRQKELYKPCEVYLTRTPDVGFMHLFYRFSGKVVSGWDHDVDGRSTKFWSG
jgi:hypothetical protein